MSTGSRLRRLRTHAEAAPAAPTARGGTSLAGLESRLYESFTSVLPAWAFRAAADPFAYGLTGGAPFGTATGTVSDRQHGRNVPLVWSELDLRGYRILSRQLCDSNQFAIGFLKLLSAFHIRKGYGWQACLKGAKKTPYPTAAGPVDPLVEKAQQILDAWRDANQWPLLSREAFRRWCRDGEVFGRWFPQGYGELSRFRFIEPEQVGSPTGDTSDIDSYGIETERGDVCTPTAYHVWKLDESLEGDWVDADRIVHARKNVDSGIKRGLPDFYPVAEDLDGVRRLLRGLTASAIKQARTAWIEKFKSATVEQVRAQLPVYAASGSNNLQLQGTDDVTRAIIEQFGRFGLNGQALADVRKVEGDREFVPGPTTNAGPLIEVEQAVLRGAGVVWNFPEYFSGDASNNNFASSLVSGSPFTVTVESSQFEWGCVWERPAAIKALEFARDAGLLSYQEWSRLDVEVTEPAVVTPQPDKDTQTYVQQLQARIVSLDTVRQKLGYDPQHEAEGVKKDAATAPPPPGGAPGAPGQEPPPDQGPPGGDGGGGPPGTDDPMAGLFGEQAVAEGLTDAQYALLTVEARAGLIQKDVQVHSGGRVFTQKRWVRPDAAPAAKPAGAAPGPAVAQVAARQKEAMAKAVAKFRAAPKPTREEVAANRAGMKRLGANLYRKNLVGNSKDRAKRRAALLKEFGDGTQCPCVYCGVLVKEGTLEQDKLYTTAQGGRYRLPNLVPSCSACNKVRSDKSFAEVAGIKAREQGAEQGDAPAGPAATGPAPTEEHRALAAKWVGAAADLPEPLKAKYAEDMAHALAGIPAGALKSATDTMALRKFGPTFHPDKAALNAKASALTGKRVSGVEGFVQTKGGSTVGLHLDGGSETDAKATYTARGTYAHELWHVVDDGYHSETPAWKTAWKSEIKGARANNKLSAYALTNESEGFAEFGRFLAERGADETKRRYPKCFAYLQKAGLV